MVDLDDNLLIVLSSRFNRIRPQDRGDERPLIVFSSRLNRLGLRFGGDGLTFILGVPGEQPEDHGDRPWTFFVVNGRREARIRIESRGALVEIAIGLNEPISAGAR